MDFLNSKACRFMMWAMVIWGVGEVVNNAIEGDYKNAVIDTALGLGWIWWLSRDK